MDLLEAYRQSMKGTPQERVQRALEAAGDRPALLGFDANGIQAMVTASKRPLANAGASKLLLELDREQREKPETVFAGGARGLLVTDKERAESEAQGLRDRFSDRTGGGVLATAVVPYDAAHPGASLALFRMKMGLAKDAARPPREPEVTSNAGVCPDCRSRPAEVDIHVGADRVRICARCRDAIEKGRDERRKHERALAARGQTLGEEPRSLEDLAEGSRIGVVSADGNDLGVFFDGLETLQGYSAASFAVGHIVREAHRAALEALGHHRYIDPVTGGDDIRVFLPPSSLATYVTELLAAVENLARDVDAIGGALAQPNVERLSKLRLGVGALVAPAHFSAARLLQETGRLEKTAKAHAKKEGEKAEDSKHGVAFSYLTTGDAIGGDEGDSPSAEKGETRLPTQAMTGEQWTERLGQAEALAQIPYSQLGATLRPKHQLHPAEATNIFRYQVSRHPAWQAWLAQVAGEDAWRHPETCTPDMINQTLLDLLRLQRTKPDRSRGGAP